MKSSRLRILLLILLLAGIALIRYRMAGLPLERDEGEYAYMGQLILQGIPPYTIVYNMKLPGIYVIYAGIMALLGQTSFGIHLGLLFVNLCTVLLVCLLARRFLSPWPSLAAAAAFAILSISPALQGVVAHAEHFVLIPALAGIILMLKGLEEKKSGLVFLSGLLLGTALVIIQLALPLVAFGAAYVALHYFLEKPARPRAGLWSVLVFGAGAIIPYGLTCLILYMAGVFDSFMFWTVKYALAYVGQVPFDAAWMLFRDHALSITGAAPLFWGLAALGLIALFFDKPSRDRRAFFLLFFLFSFLAVCPGFYFRHHYFVLLLPAAALLAGCGIQWIGSPTVRPQSARFGGAAAATIVIFAVAVPMFRHNNFYFRMTPAQASRSLYSLNPFPESVEIARYLREHSTPQDRIAVLGSEPQIFFYSRRRSATGHIYMYPLMENHPFAAKMQENTIREITDAEPEYLVYVAISTSWLIHSNSDHSIFKWFHSYRDREYHIDGLIELFTGRDTVYHWGPEAAGIVPTSNLRIYILKRNG